MVLQNKGKIVTTQSEQETIEKALKFDACLVLDPEAKTAWIKRPGMLKVPINYKTAASVIDNLSLKLVGTDSQGHSNFALKV